ncbi:MAG TPA: nucleoside monophosphate kinase [Candidatus Paceibacterota bacterium]|nr:nucleoside monophosphate kinase [Verrucomicrobiota bacterium]HRY48600.1 nucleoside monophosphate kinase [Candidatus Paceibacterota bacterium]HSA01266.1 nucleoside monophosphate kinase [Candidatus Paceibacterota bacterium]
MKYSTILLFGAPGAGKGTQGKVLGVVPNFFHNSCGDVFRSLTVDSELGRIFLDYSARGQLVPDEYTVRLWHESIKKREQAGQFRPERDTLILDGIPRNLAQAKLLEDTLNVKAVFNLLCADRNKLVERLQRRALRENRLDDASLEVIRRRLETYENETRPVLDFYGPKLVIQIDATLTPIQVLHNILEVVARREGQFDPNSWTFSRPS